MLNNILNSSQSGFRKYHSTTSTLLDVQDFILQNMDKGNVTAALFLDLKKALVMITDSLLTNSRCMASVDMNFHGLYHI